MCTGDPKRDGTPCCLEWRSCGILCGYGSICVESGACAAGVCVELQP
jgi:hypothetical protein